MTQRRNTERILLAVACGLAAMLIIGPAAAMAQGPAANEYDLGPLPQAGGDGGGGESSSPASIAAGSSDAGGVPVMLIVLVGAAAVCTAVAVWRVRTSRTL